MRPRYVILCDTHHPSVFQVLQRFSPVKGFELRQADTTRDGYARFAAGTVYRSASLARKRLATIRRWDSCVCWVAVDIRNFRVLS
jgi:hypothetical protein